MTTSAWMGRALALAEQIKGRTSPNPWVGCVIVRDGRVVGEGVTQPPGGAHAEVMALRAAADEARGSTVYVTLEPCSHHGRTPPCTDVLIAAGVAKVVFALQDPDQRVSGSGALALRDAGIEVEQSDGELEAAKQLEAYLKHRRTGQPFVTVKYAATLDGRIAAASGDSRWVSGPDTLRWAHEGRTRLDAILVGSSTIVIDNPQLTARPEGRDAEQQPLRIVLDSTGRVSAAADVLKGDSFTLIASTQRSSVEWRQAITQTGAEVLLLPEDEAGRVALRPLLAELGSRGIVTLLVEGGGIVIGSFVDQRLVDKVTAVIAPKIVGAANAAGPIAGRGASRMSEAVTLRDMTVERLGSDILVTGYPVWPEASVSKTHL